MRAKKYTYKRKLKDKMYRIGFSTRESDTGFITIKNNLANRYFRQYQ